MSLVNRDNLMAILSDTKTNIENKINKIKFDMFEATIPGTYTKMTNIPYSFYYGSAVSIGTNIYILGGSSSRTYNYKYDIATDTYTANTVIPYSFSIASAVIVNDNIYLLGGTSSRTYNYKYSLSYIANCIIKPANNSIYTYDNKSYTDNITNLIEIGDQYYTEYNGDTIVKNTYPIDENGSTKMYIKSGAILNGNTVTVDTEGWNDINLLDYM